jgi:hypothetical protein
MFFDFSRTMTRKTYYQVGFKFRTSPEIEVAELNGQFGSMKKATSFEIPSCSSDFNFNAVLQIVAKKNLKPGQEFFFQLACIFTDQFNKRFIRTINYKISSTDNLDKLYKHVDTCALTKLTVNNAINFMKETSLKEARKILNDTIVDLLYYYRKTVSYLYLLLRLRQIRQNPS